MLNKDQNKRTIHSSDDGTARRIGPPPEPAVLSLMVDRVKDQPHNTAFAVYENGFWRQLSYSEIRHRSNWKSNIIYICYTGNWVY